jgi:hypothetical protein
LPGQQLKALKGICFKLLLNHPPRLCADVVSWLRSPTLNQSPKEETLIMGISILRGTQHIHTFLPFFFCSLLLLTWLFLFLFRRETSGHTMCCVTKRNIKRLFFFFFFFFPFVLNWLWYFVLVFLSVFGAGGEIGD